MRKFKFIIFSFIFLFLLFNSSYSYGSVKYLFVKSWIINGTQNSNYTLNATFLSNNSFQSVSSINLSEGKIIKSGENLLFYSNGLLNSDSKMITVSAIVETHYSPFIKSDFKFIDNFTPHNKIESRVNSLIDRNSKLNTLISLNSWIHGYIIYDTHYSNLTDPFKVFNKRVGVCTAYSSLLGYSLNYLNFDYNQVSGYTFSSFWEPHAWDMVKIGDEFVPIDATYNQISLLSPSHIATFIGEDAFDYSDSLSVFGHVDSFNHNVSISKFQENAIPIPLYYDYIDEENGISLNISNPTSDYLLVPFSFRVSDGWGGEVNRIFILFPKKKLSLSYSITQPPDLDSSYAYSVPFVLSLMGEDFDGSISYVPTKVKMKNDISNIPICSSLFIILFSFIFTMFYFEYK